MPGNPLARRSASGALVAAYPFKVSSKGTVTYKKRKSFNSKVKGVINAMAEDKYHDVNQTAFSTDFSWKIDALSSVPQAAGASTDLTRIGDEIRGRYIDLRYQIAAGDVTNLFRICLVRWNGDGTPAAADFISLNSSANAAITPFKHDNRNLFNVLYDRLHSTTTSGSNQSVNVMKRILLRNKRINYLAGATTNVKGGLYLIYVSDSAAAAHPAINYHTRLSFSDM